MNLKNQIYFFSGLIVAISVVLLDQLVAPWPVEPDFFFGIIVYRTYLIYYLLGFLIGAIIFCILCVKKGVQLDFYSWSYFTFVALLVTLPTLIFVVYVASHANVFFIILTDTFSLTFVFLPTGLILGGISSSIKSSGTEPLKAYDPKDPKSSLYKIIMGFVGGIITNIVSGYIQYLLF